MPRGRRLELVATEPFQTEDGNVYGYLRTFDSATPQHTDNPVTTVGLPGCAHRCHADGRLRSIDPEGDLRGQAGPYRGIMNDRDASVEKSSGPDAATGGGTASSSDKFVLCSRGKMDEYPAQGFWENSARKRDVRGKEICYSVLQPVRGKLDYWRTTGGDGELLPDDLYEESMDDSKATRASPNYDATSAKGRKTINRIATRQADLRAFCKQGMVDDLQVTAFGDGAATSSVVDHNDPFENLPDHILTEVLVRLPAGQWPAAACVQKRWAKLFRGDAFWKLALVKRWPRADSSRRWPGPIGRGSSKRQYTALHVSKTVFDFEEPDYDVHEVAGHVYLFLKEQLESSTLPLSYALLHGTIIDQFLACGKAGEAAHELASKVWLAVLDNLDESETTFRLLMRIAEEWEIFLPFPYSKSQAVQWKLFERLFTDFRDCLTQARLVSNVHPTYLTETYRVIHEYAMLSRHGHTT